MFTVPHCHKNCTSLSSHSLLVRVDSLGAHSVSRHASQHFCSDPKGSCLDPYILSAPHDTMLTSCASGMRTQTTSPSPAPKPRIPRLSRGVRHVPSTCRLSLRGHYSYFCRTATRRPASGWQRRLLQRHLSRYVLRSERWCGLVSDHRVGRATRLRSTASSIPSHVGLVAFVLLRSHLREQAADSARGRMLELRER